MTSALSKGLERDLLRYLHRAADEEADQRFLRVWAHTQQRQQATSRAIERINHGGHTMTWVPSFPHRGWLGARIARKLASLHARWMRRGEHPDLPQART